ncbi:MAG: hypothetical protein ACXWJ5_09185, partial [Xanthobacteraceae bacterium]
LFGEQSIWRNGTNVCHAKHLVIGDEIYDDADHPVVITSLETIEDNSLIWYRFDISGDHSYIIDGLTVHNASRFWVGGTGTWDSSTTTHWAASSNGAGGQSVPGSADTVALDGNSGGGTVTLNFGGTITIQSLSMGSFTGTFENSVNNNNITASAGTGFALGGGASKTFNLGSATYTLTHAAAIWDYNAGGGTFNGGSSTITFTGTSGVRVFKGGDKTYGTVNLGTSTGAGTVSVTGNDTIQTLNITAPNWIEFQGGGTITIINAVAWMGTSTSQIAIVTNSNGTTTNIAFAAGSAMQWCAFRCIIGTGSPVATNSFNLGNNSGIAITPPGGGSFSGGFFS